ncbi:hypothetical protein EVAR_66302_1 [Eumeta japonica]|uniref:Uncharacterized protein n=1 Tax=Eumeta variegata TaxID=151549 RepID=A0A4C1ZB02_EUMVA|nr:hypothetical protein EVAR_66302_1 [Eumeta japonica]
MRCAPETDISMVSQRPFNRLGQFAPRHPAPRAAIGLRITCSRDAAVQRNEMRITILWPRNSTSANANIFPDVPISWTAHHRAYGVMDGRFPLSLTVIRRLTAFEKDRTGIADETGGIV